jgi:hypothetical protein
VGVGEIRDRMSDDRQEEQTEKSQQDLHNPHRSGQIDQSLRTDKNYIGAHIALYLVIASVIIYLLDAYTVVAAGSVFMLAILVAVISFPYKTFREEK